jgi:hypothetical protein
LKRCLQYCPLSPAGHVQKADSLLPFFWNVTLYGSSADHWTRNCNFTMKAIILRFLRMSQTHFGSFRSMQIL